MSSERMSQLSNLTPPASIAGVNHLVPCCNLVCDAPPGGLDGRVCAREPGPAPAHRAEADPDAPTPRARDAQLRGPPLRHPYVPAAQPEGDRRALHGDELVR